MEFASRGCFLSHQVTESLSHYFTTNPTHHLRLLPLCLALLTAHAAYPRTSALAQTANLTRVLLDTDANNELDDQHAIAYMLFSGDVFDVEGITVNKTRGGGDVETQAVEAERITTLAGLARVFPVFRGANGSFAEIAPHLGDRTSTARRR